MSSLLHNVYYEVTTKKAEEIPQLEIIQLFSFCLCRRKKRIKKFQNPPLFYRNLYPLGKNNFAKRIPNQYLPELITTSY